MNPVDYKVWSAVQEQVYKTKLTDTEERTQTVSGKLDRRVIDRAVKLAACQLFTPQYRIVFVYVLEGQRRLL